MLNKIQLFIFQQMKKNAQNTSSNIVLRSMYHVHITLGILQKVIRETPMMLVLLQKDLIMLDQACVAGIKALAKKRKEDNSRREEEEEEEEEIIIVEEDQEEEEVK